MQFLSKYISSKSADIILIYAKDAEGSDCYFYILKNKLHKQNKVQAGDKFDVESIGKIIESGFGNEPTDRSKRKIKNLYHFE